MKILFIAGLDSPHSHRWINSFASQGHEIGWINLRKTTKKTSINCKLRPRSAIFSSESINLIATYVYYIFRILIWKPDAVHIHYMGLNGLMGLLVPCKNKVFTAWGSDVIFPKFPRLLNLMIRRADLLTTDAQHVVDKLISLGAKSDQVKIINFGIETDFFVKKPKDEQYREKLFKGTAEDPIIISLRNHETVYDIETLIESIPIVLKEIPNAKFAIGGSGTLTSKYTELVKSLSVEESVNFFGSYIHDELPNLFSQVHAYVSTSLSDAGLSASTAEAMSCEVPVIISNSGENSLWVTDDENGDLFPIKDSQELAIRIMNNIKHRELSIKKGQKGREIIVRDNDVINEMKKMNELYSTFS